MKKLFFLILISFCSIGAQSVPETFYKRFEGTIDNKYNITVNLIKTDSALSGNYYYNNKGQLIEFTRSSVDRPGNIFLEEDAGYDDSYNPIITGTFKGKFTTENKIEGTWEKPNSNKPLALYLEEKYPEGSAKFEVTNNKKSYNKWGSASIEISSIEMVNYKDMNVQEKINKDLNKSLLGHSISSDDSEGYKSIDDMVNGFIDSYVSEIVDDSANYTDYVPQYEYGSSSEILYNSGYLLSIRTVDFSYLGGAHPNTYISLKSYNLNTGEPVKLDDVFKPGYEKKLNLAGEKKFRAFYKISDSDPLDSSGFWFEHGFSLNENFAFTKGAIIFLFNQYEVGPYALGAPEVYIPFSEIKDLIKENSIIGIFNSESTPKTK